MTVAWTEIKPNNHYRFWLMMFKQHSPAYKHLVNTSKYYGNNTSIVKSWLQGTTYSINAINRRHQIWKNMTQLCSWLFKIVDPFIHEILSMHRQHCSSILSAAEENQSKRDHSVICHIIYHWTPFQFSFPQDMITFSCTLYSISTIKSYL